LICSTIGPAGTSPAIGGGKTLMKAMMAIACVCAGILATMGVMRMRNNDMQGMGNQRRRMRHG
jgi:hypothetical protein